LYSVIIELFKRNKLLEFSGKVKSHFAAISRNSSVLVGIAERIETPERMGVEACLSVIRLKRTNLGFGGVGHSKRLGIEPAPSVGVINTQDRKLCMVGIDDAATSLSKTPDELIQGASHAV
jgi:hypothetical protein